MKKAILIFCTILIVGLVSCNKTEYIQPEPTNKTFVRELVAGDWDRVSNALIKCDIPLNDLTDYYILQGNVSVALSMDNEVSYDALPATISAISYTVNYTKGFVTIYADDPLSDDAVITPIPSSVAVKIVLSQSEFVN